MFIPKTAPLYENLATSFVLVDALVHDLCEGGFVGVMEIGFRDGDCRIIIGQGGVLSSAEAQESAGVSLISQEQIAAKSRSERAAISVYKLSHEFAAAMAKRMLADRLYSGLSTEFADLEKMVSKLGREREREWFIEISAESGLKGLIHLKGGSLHAATSDSSIEEGDESAKRLIEECKSQGGSFDVYYSGAGDIAAPQKPQAPAQVSVDVSPPVLAQEPPRPTEVAADKATLHATAMTNNEPVLTNGSKAAAGDRFKSVAETEFSAKASTVGSLGTPVAVAAEPQLVSNPMPSIRDTETPAPAIRIPAPSAFATGELADAEMMIGVKRLLAEIASVIEGSTRQIENRNTFSMYLRAGQLKIADRYPFLDPFGSEFEYHAGEIAFVGKDKPEVFVEGVTEALRLAVVGVVEASTSPDRLRSQILDDLYMLAERSGPELAEFGMDNCIDQIIG